MRLATTIGEFYPYVGTPAAAVRQYEGTGFRCLDYSFWDDNEPGAPMQGDDWRKIVEAAGEEAAKLGFTFVQAHSPNYNPMDPRTDHERGMLTTRRAIEACAMLGIPNIVVHPGCGADCRYPQGREEYFRVNKAFYESLFPVMEKTGVNVLIENSAERNSGGAYFFMTGQEMSDFVQYVGHPLLHCCWDIGHAHMRGVDQYEEITAIGKDLNALHIQDNFGGDDVHIAPFMGTVDMDAVVQALIDMDYKGIFTFESDYGINYGGRKTSPHVREPRLQHPTAELKRQQVKLLYESGKYILSRYGIFEY